MPRAAGKPRNLPIGNGELSAENIRPAERGANDDHHGTEEKKEVRA